MGQTRQIGRSDQFEEGTATRVEVDGVGVAVVRANGRLYAVDDICSHAHYRLSEGEVYVEDLEIECWKHGSTFSLLDGHPTCLPATQPVRVWQVQEADGVVSIVSEEE